MRPLKALNRTWLRYEYKHTTIAILGIVLFVFLFDSAFMASIFSFLKSQHYLGAFIAGIMAASFFTAAPALVLVLELAMLQLDPLWLAVLVGLGSAVGDLLLMLFFEERIFYELRPLFKRLKLKFLVRRPRRNSRGSSLLLLAGAFIIVSPLPDEIGLGLLGISRFPQIFIFVVCLALNTLGAALLILAVRTIAG